MYIEFAEKDIGQKTRDEEMTKFCMFKDDVDTDLNWTMIECERENIKRAPTGGQYHVERTQFCLIEAESITIHKSQGQTYECVAVNLEDKLKTSLMYVGFSRCTRLENLYLYGRRTIENDTIRGMSFERRQKEVELLERTDDVRKEMRRLRTHKLMNNKLKFLEEEVESINNQNCIMNNIINNGKINSVNIIFQNICNLKANKHQLTNDYGYKQADIILLNECHAYPHQFMDTSRLFNSETHEMIHFSCGNKSLNSSNGQVCFVRKSLLKSRSNSLVCSSRTGTVSTNESIVNQQTQQSESVSLTFIADNANLQHEYTPKEHGDLKKLVELSIFLCEFNDNIDRREQRQRRPGRLVYILSVYKHPKCSFNKCLDQMYQFLSKNIPKNSGGGGGESLLVLGDFNVDFNRQDQYENFQNIQKKLGLKPLFLNEKTFQYKTHIDWAFKSQNFMFEIESQVYDTWFSDHSAIWTKINFDNQSK